MDIASKVSESENHSANAGAGVLKNQSKCSDFPVTCLSWRSVEHVEFMIHLCAWSFGCLYGIYQACKFAFDNAKRLSPDDFEEGWQILDGRRRDVSDYEWAAATHIIFSAVFWNVSHLILGAVAKKWMPKLLPFAYIGISLASYISLVGFAPALFLLAHTLTLYAFQLFKSKIICWLFNILLLIFLNDSTGSHILDLLVQRGTFEEYIFFVTISWTICRTISFCMIGCQRTDAWATNRPDTGCGPCHKWHEGLTLYLAYCFYLPLLYLGPLVMYDTFERDFCRPPLPWSIRRVLKGLAGVARYTFWLLFLEFLSHFVHLSALHYSTKLVAELSAWPLCGLCFGMSQLFLVKYAVFYGLHTELARLDGFESPDPPKCIARIHLYSEMWKHFDGGLYNFLKRNIYIPIIRNSKSSVRRLLAGAASFTFVFGWHGATRVMFIWSFLNYVGVVLENSFNSVTSIATISSWLQRNLNETARRHLKALVSAPLLMMSAISNFYFICGGLVGQIVVNRIVMEGWPFPALAVLAFLYSMCYMAEEIKIWENKKKTCQREHHD